MSQGAAGQDPPAAALEVHAVTGMPEVVAGDDLAALLLGALATGGRALLPGDCLVVSSKVVSKSRGLTWDGERAAAVEHHTRRVVAERTGSTGITRVVESVAGPVMAAAGVDASNTGPGGGLLLLPEDPDAEAAALRSALRAGAGLGGGSPLGVVLSDTAGRPWRVGQTDLALGSAGFVVLQDLRGGTDLDGRPLAVTARALADEVCAAADLAKGKADAIPAALLRGLPAHWFSERTEGARSLVRAGPEDWFALGPVEALRAALGAPAGSAAAAAVGIRSVAPEALAQRVGRVVALALREVPDGSADVEVAGDRATLTLGAPDPYDLGRLVVRVQVAAAAEDLAAQVLMRSAGALTLRLA